MEENKTAEMTDKPQRNINLMDEDERPLVPKRSVKYGDLREPETHTKNRNFFERIFGSCFGDIRNQISVDELIPYYLLKEQANTFIDAKGTEYDNQVKQLGYNLMGVSLTEIVDQRWKEFGFQNENPRSDFRGGGVISLRNLINYSANQPEEIKIMIKPENDFLFAISSINVTYFLLTYYHLPDTLVFEKDKERIASRTAFKSFCIILEKNENILSNIHDLLLKDLFDIWMQLKKTIPNMTLLDFHMPKDIVFEKYVSVTKNQYFDSFAQIQQRYRERRVELPRRKIEISTSKLK